METVIGMAGAAVVAFVVGYVKGYRRGVGVLSRTIRRVAKTGRIQRW